MLVEIEVGWFSALTTGSGGGGTTTGVGSELRITAPTITSPMNQGQGSGQGSGIVGLKSAFSSRSGKILRFNLNAALGRILEEAMDVLVCLHDGDGKVDDDDGKGTKVIVECVRDERGDVEIDENGVGMWTVWEK